MISLTSFEQPEPNVYILYIGNLGNRLCVSVFDSSKGF